MRRADMLFGVGGGRACDLCKYVPQSWINRCFCFLQWPATALVTAISVMYHPDGTFREDYYPNLPEHHPSSTPASLAGLPYALLWAGIGTRSGGM